MDNLRLYREKKQRTNRELVEAAIRHIATLGGVCTLSSVSAATKAVADSLKGQKGLTVAALSKNPEYRAMIERAAASNPAASSGRAGKKPGNFGEAGLALLDYRIRVEKLERENRILKSHLLQKDDTLSPGETMRRSREDALAKRALLDMLTVLDENKIIEIDSTTSDVRIVGLNVKVLDGSFIEKLFTKKV